eukprot:1195702-Prorocentrum_minimum.AAC.3
MQLLMPCTTVVTSTLLPKYPIPDTSACAYTDDASLLFKTLSCTWFGLRFGQELLVSCEGMWTWSRTRSDEAGEPAVVAMEQASVVEPALLTLPPCPCFVFVGVWYSACKVGALGACKSSIDTKARYCQPRKSTINSMTSWSKRSCLNPSTFK